MFTYFSYVFLSYCSTDTYLQLLSMYYWGVKQYLRKPSRGVRWRDQGWHAFKESALGGPVVAVFAFSRCGTEKDSFGNHFYYFHRTDSEQIENIDPEGRVRSSAPPWPAICNGTYVLILAA
ncbi:hypothetical protein ACTXM3_08565 [Glutamicibacter arilaitensis]|uniref:hypothetical protein n=1 Tax=Glutamicibacter arilaitensis TaxID=256701 RepID=UPI003FD513FC